MCQKQVYFEQDPKSTQMNKIDIYITWGKEFLLFII